MRFNVKASSDEEFDDWVLEVNRVHQPVTTEGYKALAEPGRSKVGLIILPSQKDCSKIL